MKYEYLITSSLVGQVEGESFSAAVKEANKVCAGFQEEVERSNLNLNLRLAVESVQKVYD